MNSKCNAVDLGLSVLWADCNLGADKPSDPGLYYAWGETAAKNAFVRNTYRFKPQDEWDFDVVDDYYEYRSFTKYDGEDGKTALDEGDDAASAALGEGWRIPTVKDWEELLDSCDVIFSPERKGCEVVSRINAQRIFLPLTGFHFFDELDFGDGFEGEDSYGLYWSADLSPVQVCEAQALMIPIGKNRFRDIARESGLVIRAVLSPRQSD